VCNYRLALMYALGSGIDVSDGETRYAADIQCLEYLGSAVKYEFGNGVSQYVKPSTNVCKQLLDC
jgi:hypothetical protein